MSVSSRALRSVVVGLVLLTLAALGGVAPTSAAPAAGVSASSRWVMGYYPGYLEKLMPVGQIDWSAMTHIVVGPVVPNDDGSLDTTYDIDPTHGPALAKQLARAAKKHHVVPLLMIGGAGAQSQFESAAGNHMSSFVSALVATMRNSGYVGLDLDWEPVSVADESLLMNLVDQLKADDPGIVLTVPVGWVASTGPGVDTFYGQLAKQVARLDIMGYGMAGAYPGWKTWYSSPLHGAKPNTPADIASNVKAYEAAGVPAGKLGIGIGFYGTCWAGGVNGPNQQIGNSYIKADDNVMTYTAILRHYYKASAYHYDAKAEAPYLGFAKPTGPQGCTFVSYENPRSIKAKGAFAVSHHLGGAIVWTIQQAHVLGAPAGHTDPLLVTTRMAFKA